MLKFTLSPAFSMMEEGTYDFEISNIEVKDESDYGNLDVIVTFKADAGTHKEYYSLVRGKEENEITKRMLSQLYNAAMGSDLAEEEVDLGDIKGKHIVADIKHQTYLNKSGEEKTAAHIRNIQPSSVVVNEPVKEINSLEDLFN